ncbi:acyl-CoA dehydrogenase [Bacillus sp. AGMB 02131]|uniref:Acyl-CoA dehydrogenase n=1 Tax=Peribacillus faecalis TaxID=2772559 RepID=A0A927CUB7_9BACI|nr:acyl-CoA dehydrogenase family protein [Peribacillus faecalis]MBD3107201.1 acyl-CoA dehydrogenase [Peribacillus faecalis]
MPSAFYVLPVNIRPLFPLAEVYIVNWLLKDIGEQVTEEIVTVSCSDEKLQLEKKENGFLISGTLKDVPYARFAQKLLVLTGEIAILLDLKKAEMKHGQNLAGEARDEVYFCNVFVENGQLISVQKKQTEKKLRYLGALTRTVMMAGALERILELAVNYAKGREQFARPLHRFQVVQQQLALLAGEVAAAGIAAEYAATSYGGNPFSKEIALAKVRVNEAAGKASAIAHQVLAAIGFTHEHTLHHSTRRLRAWRDEYGTETDWGLGNSTDRIIITNEELRIVVTGDGCRKSFRKGGIIDERFTFFGRKQYCKNSAESPGKFECVQ